MTTLFDMTGNLMRLTLADDPEAWRAAGFAVVDDQMELDSVQFCFTGSAEAELDAGRGIRGWFLEGISPGANLDGLAHCGEPEDLKRNMQHPNGISGIDHLVIATPNLPRTISAFEEAGLEARRTRTFRVGETERQQTFFWAGSTILEMIGIVGEEDEGPAGFWGLAFVSEDIDATAASMAGRISAPKDAIQPGRRIATLDTDSLNISVPVAVMTPHAKRAEKVSSTTK